MTEEVAPALAEALRQQSSLVRLNLDDTSLQDEGISAIAEVPETFSLFEPTPQAVLHPLAGCDVLGFSSHGLPGPGSSGVHGDIS